MLNGIVLNVVGPTPLFRCSIVVPHYFKMTNNFTEQDLDEQPPLTKYARIGEWS
jgi:hypothetical protein